MNPPVYHDLINLSSQAFHDLYPKINYMVWYTDFVDEENDDPFLGLSQDANEDTMYRWYTSGDGAQDIIVDGELLEAVPAVILMFPKTFGREKRKGKTPLIVLNKQCGMESLFLPFITSLTQLSFGQEKINPLQIRFRHREVKLLNHVLELMKDQEKQLLHLGFSYTGMSFQTDEVLEIMAEITEMTEQQPEEDE